VPKTLSGQLAAYYRHQEVLNKSPETIERQGFQMKKWLAFCAEQGIKSVEQVTPKHVRNFQVYLYAFRTKTNKPLGVHTQNCVLAGVRLFLRWAVMEGLLTDDPSKHVRNAKEPKRLPKTVLTTTEMRRILDAPDVKTDLGCRNRAFLELLYSSMARRNEIRCLRLNDIRFDNGTVFIENGKGAKSRMLPIGKVAGDCLKRYIQKVRPRLLKDKGKDDGYVFLSKHGVQMCRDTVNCIVKDSAQAAGIVKNVHTHVFRASGLTHMLRNGANVRHLMDLAGHSSMQSLNPYLAVEITDLKETHARTHPREVDGL
jgi:integrase/recombinase XerD